MGGSAILGNVVKSAGFLFSNIKDVSSKVVQSVAGYELFHVAILSFCFTVFSTVVSCPSVLFHSMLILGSNPAGSNQIIYM